MILSAFSVGCFSFAQGGRRRSPVGRAGKHGKFVVQHVTKGQGKARRQYLTARVNWKAEVMDRAARLECRDSVSFGRKSGRIIAEYDR